MRRGHPFRAVPSRSKTAMPQNYKADVDAAVKDVDFSKNTYQIELDTTKGKILVDLWPDVAPGHAKNIIGLAKVGFYDGIIFHRVISGFMIQVGCPQGTGTGGPGYTIKQEFNDRPHEPGVLSMARTNDPNSAGSQFFLCLERVPHLDNQYTAFGKTADDASLKTVLSIGAVETDRSDKPKQTVKINKATVIEKAK
jgi:cyclophilin family peptidyl-prolyl cis-trans isomerase